MAVPKECATQKQYVLCRGEILEMLEKKNIIRSNVCYWLVLDDIKRNVTEARLPGRMVYYAT
jgi:hypothetical protein